MSDIRLRKITVEPSLTIQNGSINITDTTPSNSVASGSLISYGGIGILATQDATAPTSGGALTVAGGLGVISQTFLGSNLTLANPNANLVVAGGSNNRLFLDTVAGQNFYLSVNGSQKQLIVQPTSVNISVTTPSNSSTEGSMIVSGGLSIGATASATSVSAGGALTVAGGLAVASSVFLGDTVDITKKVTINKDTGSLQIGSDAKFKVIGAQLDITNGSDLQISSSIGNITLVTGTTSSVIISSQGTFLSTGLTASAGITSQGIVNLNSTLANSLVVSGSAVFNKSVSIDQNLQLSPTNGTTANKIVLYQTAGNFTGIGVSGLDSMKLNIPNSSGSFIFSRGGFNLLTVAGNQKTTFLGDSQSYSLLGYGNYFGIQGQTMATPVSFGIHTNDGDSAEDIDLRVYARGTPSNTINTEYISVGYDTARGIYRAISAATGTGIIRSLSLETENNVSQILLRTDGSVKLSSSAISMDSSSAALVSTSLSLSSTTDSSSATAGGTLTVAGGGAFAGTLFIKRQLSLANTTLTDTGSTSGFLLANTSAKFSLAGNTTNSAKASALTLYSLYDSSTVGNYSGITVGTDSSTSSIVTVANTPTKVTSLVLSTGSPSQIYLATNGNVGISTSSPNSLLSVAGSFTAQNSSLYTLNVSTGSVLRGAVTVGSDLIVTGTSTLNDQVNLYQLYVSGTTNASSTTGSVVVAGGATLGKGLYVSQDITFKGALIGASAQTATLGNLQVSNNSIIGGNLQITGTSTATNLTSASLVLSGGASILKDLRLGGQQYNSGVTLFSASGDLIQFLDPTETKRFSIYRDPSSLNLSFSRYDSLGVPVDKPFEISSATGTVFFNNNSSSAGGSSASLVAYGGLSILNTTDASGATAGGGLSILGGASIAKKLFVGGNVIFSSSTSSDLPTNGAVTVIGGLGVSGNFNLQGNAVINGNLTISGSTTSVASNNVVLSDNILVLNSGPSGSKDSGYLIQRYQFDNDTAQGDVVADLPSFSTVLPGQSGANLSQVILPVTTSSINNYYLGWWIEITSGFSNGQVRKIIGFVGSTRTVTLSSQWTNQNPSIGDSFALYNKPYVGSIYSEIRDRFEFGSTIADPGSGVGNVNLTDTLGVYMKNLVIASTTTSNTATSGSILTPGGLGISCTEDATSATSGNGLTVAGGASIAKTLYVGSQLYVNGVNITPSTGQVSSQTFNGSNGATNQDVTGAFFDSTVWSFDLYLAVRLHATTNLYSNYHVRGVSRETSWEISTDYTGDSVVSFSITSAGQLQYTSPTFAGFTDLTFKFRAQTN